MIQLQKTKLERMTRRLPSRLRKMRIMCSISPSFRCLLDMVAQFSDAWIMLSPLIQCTLHYSETVWCIGQGRLLSTEWSLRITKLVPKPWTAFFVDKDQETQTAQCTLLNSHSQSPYIVQHGASFIVRAERHTTGVIAPIQTYLLPTTTPDGQIGRILHVLSPYLTWNLACG